MIQRLAHAIFRRYALQPDRREQYHTLLYDRMLEEWRQAHPLPDPKKDRIALHEHLIGLLADVERLRFLEFGVFKGESMRRFSKGLSGAGIRFDGFDTFEGLPDSWGKIPKGGYSSAGVIPDLDDDRITFHRGLFQDTVPGFLEREASSLGTTRLFIHLDADLYSSTTYVLARFEPFLKPGDILLFDEFGYLSLHEFRAWMDHVSAFGTRARLIAGTRRHYLAAFQVE